ncbi:MAG: hypothetical protein R3C19_06235 [Planctomycetaceae bacterium]
MQRFPEIRLLILSTVIAAGFAGSAQAQLGGHIDRPFDRPTVSPYLNLFRGDNSGGVLNYYGLVRPQLDFQQANQQLGMNLQALQLQQNYLQQGGGLQRGVQSYSQLGITGHPATFMSFSGVGGGGGGIGAGGIGVGGIGGGGIGGGGFGGGIGGGFGGGFSGNSLGPNLGGGIGGFSGGLGPASAGGLGAFGGGGFGGGYGGGLGGGAYGVGLGISSGLGGGLTGHPAAFGIGGGGGYGLGR